MEHDRTRDWWPVPTGLALALILAGVAAQAPASAQDTPVSGAPDDAAAMTAPVEPPDGSAFTGPVMGPDGLPLPIADLAPVEMMEEYRAVCGGGAGQAASGSGAAAVWSHGQRCDALAEAIQALDMEDIREGHADLARPDFYTPGGE